MRAVTYAAYGSPEVIRIEDVPAPRPNDREVLVRVQESVVTPPDVATRSGNPFIVRLVAGLRAPAGIAGTDFVGVVEAAGAKVRSFRPGDRVFGSTTTAGGAHAEQVRVREDGVIATIPDGVSNEHVAGACDGGLTAWTFLRDIAALCAGQRLLVNGASGSVGSYAVQIGKHLGAHVSGVCSAANVDLVSSLGADRVIDYGAEDFTAHANEYDVIFDAVGKSSFGRCKRAMRSRGLYLTTVPSLRILVDMLLTAFGRGRRARFVATGLMYDQARIRAFRELIASGAVRAVVDRRYALDQVADAHRYVEGGHKKGSVILEIASTASR